MNKILAAVVFISVVSFQLISSNVFAQEQAPTEIDAQFSFGTVVSATATDLVVSEYNYDTDQNVDVSYVLDANTVYENVVNALELKQADEVDIEYKEVDGKKIITYLSKVKIEEDLGQIDMGLDQEPETVPAVEELAQEAAPETPAAEPVVEEAPQQ